MKKKRQISDLYDSKIFWVFISLIASIALWAYITGVQADEHKVTYRGVRVELVGEDTLRENKGLVITDLDVNTVTVELIGPRRLVGSFSADDLIAQIDVSKLSQPAYTSQQYEIVFPDKTDTGAITVSRKTPQIVNFMVSRQISKPVPVRGSFEGEPAEGYTAEMPVFEPSVIYVSGPEAYLKDISYAWVTFGKDGIQSTYSEETGFALMNDQGEECSTAGITVSDETVIATLPILAVKEVLLSVDLIEGAGATAANTKVTIEPYSVMLAGDSAVLSGKNKITLATIDLTDFKSTFTDTYTIPLDNDMQSLTGVSEATVTIEILGLDTKSYSVKNLSVINVTAGYVADIISENITVTLRGPADVLDQIKPENIRAVADVIDYNNSTGSYRVEAKVYIDGFTGVGALNSDPISIEIRKE